MKAMTPRPAICVAGSNATQILRRICVSFLLRILTRGCHETLRNILLFEVTCDVPLIERFSIHHPQF